MELNRTMKYTISILSITLILLFALYGCKKRAHKVNPDYIGTWWWCGGRDSCYCNSLSNLEIDEKSHGIKTYVGTGTEAEKYTIKGIVRIKGDKFKLGMFTSYTINQEPMKLDSSFCYDGNKVTWSMIMGKTTWYKEHEYLYTLIIKTGLNIMNNET